MTCFFMDSFESRISPRFLAESEKGDVVRAKIRLDYYNALFAAPGPSPLSLALFVRPRILGYSEFLDGQDPLGEILSIH